MKENELIRKRSKAKSVILFITFSIGFAVSNFSQYQFSPLASEIMELYGLSQVSYNALFTAPMIPAILFGILSGVLVDKYGYKPVLGVAITLTLIGAWLRVLIPSHMLMFAAMFLVGFSGDLFMANAAKVLALLFGPEKVSVLAGLVMSISTCGLVLVLSTTSLMPSMVSAFILAAVIASVGFVLWFTMMPKIKPQQKPREVTTPNNNKNGALKSVLGNKNVWFAGVVAFCACGAMSGTGSTVPAALMQERGISSEMAGVVASMMMVGNLLGSTFTPTIANKTGKFRATLMICGALSALGCAFAWLAPEGIALYAAMLVLGFAMGSGMASCMGIAVRIRGIGTEYAGTAGGMVTTLQLLGGVVLPTYIASTIAGGNYYVYFGIIGAFSLLWVICMFLLPKYLDVKSA
ncbi:MAG: MFS transporter [Oscillospiraceae bacterium]|nr:MFS transporter [Oscillospiraceae bacterium]